MPAYLVRLLTLFVISIFIAGCNGGSDDDDSSGGGAAASGQKSVSVTAPAPAPKTKNDDSTGKTSKTPGHQASDPAEDTDVTTDDSGSTAHSGDQADHDTPKTPKSDAPAPSGDESSTDAGDDTSPETDSGSEPGEATSPPEASDESDIGSDTGNDSGLSVHLGDRLADVLPSARRITTARVAGPGTQAGVLTFGQVFAQGDVGADDHLMAVADDRILDTQADIKSHWPDGSIRQAVLSVAVPRGSLDAGVVLYATDTALDLDTRTPLSVTDVLAGDFAATLHIDEAGRSYTADARQALQQIAERGDCPAWGQAGCKRWLSGPLASEWIVAVPLRDGPDATPRLRAYFHIRAYRDRQAAIANVRVDTVIENTQAYGDDPANVTYDASLDVGQAHYDVSGLTHYRQARWHRVLWSRGDPQREILPSMAYLQASKAVSHYAHLVPSDSLLDSVAQSAPPMTHANQTPDMGDTGAQAAIGPLPRWTAAYVVSGDVRAYRWMLANDDAAGSYGFHYRDEASGRPLSIVDHPYVTIADYGWASRADGRFATDLLPSCRADCSSPWHYDIAHQPSVGYVAYLTTGDFYYLEEMQFVASYDELWANESYRNYDKGRLLNAYEQVRSQAWSLRAISDAAFATPDDDPMKHYFVDQVNYIVSDYLANYVDDVGHPLHVLDDFHAVHYPANQPLNVAIAPWQQDFFTWSVGHAAEQGVPGASRMLAWLAPWYVGLMTDIPDLGGNGYCWLQASAYTLNLRDDNDSPIYTSLAQVFHRSFPELDGLACNSEAMRRAMNDGKTPTPRDEMIGYPSSPTGFPANFQIGLAMIAATPANGAAEAWRVFAGRASQPDYSDTPQFAVEPRPVDER